MSLRIVTTIFYALALSILMIGCGGGGGSQTATTASLVSIAISPASSQVTLGKSQQFFAIGAYSDGSSKDLTSQVFWSTADQTVISIGNSAINKGLATTGILGKTIISASYSGLTSSTDVTVTAATLVSIAITSIASTPLSPTLSIDLSEQWVAIGIYSDGTMQDVTTSASWSSSNQLIATVADSSVAKGVVTGLKTGTASITATIGDVVATTTFTVLPYKTLAENIPNPGMLYSTMGIDAAGNVLAVWAYQISHPGQSMYTATYDVTKGWLPTSVFSMGSINDTVSNPQVVVNDSGMGLLVWTGLKGIYSSSYVPGLGWQTPVVVMSGPSQSQTYAEAFTVKLDSAGNGLLVWSKGDAYGFNNIYSSRYLIASGWQDSDFIGNGCSFSLDLNRSGSAVLAWGKRDLATALNCTTNANTFDPISGWQPATQLNFSSFPGAAISDNGNALLVWGDQSENFYAKWYTTAGGWQPAQVIGSGDELSQYSIGVNPNGDAVVLWCTQGSYQVYSNRFVNNLGWQGAELLGNAAYNPHVRIDAAGNILALWYNAGAMPETYYFKRYLVGSGWQAQTPIWAGISSPDPHNAFLISNASGTVAYSWIEMYETFDGTYTNSFDDFFFTLLTIDGSSLQ